MNTVDYQNVRKSNLSVLIMLKALRMLNYPFYFHISMIKLNKYCHTMDLKENFQSHFLTLSNKLRLYKALLRPVLMYESKLDVK